MWRLIVAEAENLKTCAFNETKSYDQTPLLDDLDETNYEVLEPNDDERIIVIKIYTVNAR